MLCSDLAVVRRAAEKFLIDTSLFEIELCKTYLSPFIYSTLKLNPDNVYTISTDRGEDFSAAREVIQYIFHNFLSVSQILLRQMEI